MHGLIHRNNMDRPGTITFRLEENSDGSIELVGNDFECVEETILTITNEGKIAYNDASVLDGLDTDDDGFINIADC